MEHEELTTIWLRLRSRGVEEKLYANLRKRFSEELNSVQTPEDAFKVAVKYQMVSDLEAAINETLNLNEGNERS